MKEEEKKSKKAKWENAFTVHGQQQGVASPPREIESDVEDEDRMNREVAPHPGFPEQEEAE